MSELMPWMIAWAVVTTAVLILGFYRLTLGLHEDPGVYIDAAEARQAKEKSDLDHKIERVELYGKSLTAVSAVLIAITALLWVFGALGSGQRIW